MSQSEHEPDELELVYRDLKSAQEEIVQLKMLVKELADELEEEIGAPPWHPFWDLIARAYEARGEPVPKEIEGMRSKSEAMKLYGG